MQNLNTTSMQIRDNRLWILDQQALPQKKIWCPADTVAELVQHIRALRVRGAPLIGLSASLLLALLAQQGMDRPALLSALTNLLAARPTAVNLMNNLARMRQALAQTEYRDAMVREALRLLEEDRAL